MLYTQMHPDTTHTPIHIPVTHTTPHICTRRHLHGHAYTPRCTHTHTYVYPQAFTHIQSRTHIPSSKRPPDDFLYMWPQNNPLTHRTPS